MVDFDMSQIVQGISIGLTNAASNVVQFIPNLVVAILILLIGFFVTGIVRHVILGLLDFFKVEAVLKKYKVEDAMGGSNVSSLVASLIRWWVMLWFLQAAITVLNLPTMTWIINEALYYVPALIGSALLVIAAAVAGEWVREAINGMHKFYMQQTLSQMCKWFVVGIALVTGLKTIGFRVEIIEGAILTLLQGIVYGVAIAFGLAFGLGGQKDASDIIRKARKKFGV